MIKEGQWVISVTNTVGTWVIDALWWLYIFAHMIITVDMNLLTWIADDICKYICMI